MTREQTIESIRIMQAWVDGKEVECQYHGSETLSNAPNPSWNWFDCTYRIKPTATLRPWTADEVPLGSWMRNLAGTRCLIVDTATDLTRWDWSMANMHSTDGGVTWKPCGVLEDKL